MEPQPNEPTTDQSQSMANPQDGVQTKKVVTKKITKVTKSASGKPKGAKKVTKSKKVVAVKNAQIENQNVAESQLQVQNYDQSQLQSQILSQIQTQNPNQNILPPKMQRQVLPNQVYQKELPVQNREAQVNKQYKLKDIVNKTQTMVNYLKALSTTVVKPVIVQEVTTRKPIIAPVDIKTPVNFFEGQPLNEEDLIIQNFFKNTTPVYDEKISNSIIYNNNSILSQSLQYPSMQQPQYNNTNYLSQSMQYPSQNQTYFENNTIASSTNYVRPQVEKVQLKTVSGEEFNQPKKKIKKKKGKIVKKTKKTKTVTQSQNVAASQQNVAPIQKNVSAIQQNVAIQQNMVPRQPIQQNVNVVQQNVNVVKQSANVLKQSANVIQPNTNVIHQNINVSQAANSQVLRPQAKVQNITVNNSLKNAYPPPEQQKKIVVQEEEEDDEKMPRDSIREKK